MALACIVRTGQRRRLIEKILRELKDKFEINPDFTRAVLANILSESSSPGLISVRNRDAVAFWAEASAMIRKFARAKEEEAVLVNQFFSEASKLLADEPLAALARLETSDPQKIFHASSATANLESDAREP